MRKVFLGGTCNESTWRDELMPLLKNEGVEYFNPVVEDLDSRMSRRGISSKGDLRYTSFSYNKEDEGRILYCGGCSFVSS